MQIIKTYKKYNTFDQLRRQHEERKLFAKGYRIVSEEEVKSFDGCLGCSLFILFPPLALLARSQSVKVVYDNVGQN